MEREPQFNVGMTTMIRRTRTDGSKGRGFTLIELLIALAIVAILVRIAFPSYQAYIVRSSRQSAQSELIALANAQEKIFLNSNAYTSSVTSAYTGQSTGGLGVTSGKSKDDRYTILGRGHGDDVHPHRDPGQRNAAGRRRQPDDQRDRSAHLGQQDLVATVGDAGDRA